MIFKTTLLLIGLLSSNVTAERNLRAETHEEETKLAEEVGEIEHLDLEVILDNGDRELFPLLPGTKCPTGHHCRLRTHFSGVSPMTSALKDNLKRPLAMALNWEEFNTNIKATVASDSFCDRRKAMARAAGLAAGLTASAVSNPAYAAETKEVKMGSDSGLLAFVPNKITICKGDSITWINNKGGPHNVVFDEEAIPAGVDYEAISQFDQMGEEDETFTMKFDTAGDYAYYCEPHRGAGMNANLIVI